MKARALLLFGSASILLFSGVSSATPICEGKTGRAACDSALAVYRQFKKDKLEPYQKELDACPREPQTQKEAQCTTEVVNRHFDEGLFDQQRKLRDQVKKACGCSADRELL